MNIGFVVVNYNDSKNVIKLINSIKDFKCLKLIVVVDNASTDSSIEELNKLKLKNLCVIENEENYGYAKALNIGSKYIMDNLDNPLICMSNTDIVIPNESVIKDLANLIDDDVKCVSPKVKEGSSFTYGWRLTSPFQDLLINLPLINRLIRNKLRNYPDDYFNEENKEIDVVYGCFFMIEGNTLRNINYFDEDTFLYYEEYILARKLKRVEKHTLQNTKVHVSHVHNATIGTNLSRLNKYKIYKRSQLYYEKHYNNANILEMFIFKLFYYINLIPYVIKSKH